MWKELTRSSLADRLKQLVLMTYGAHSVENDSFLSSLNTDAQARFNEFSWEVLEGFVNDGQWVAEDVGHQKVELWTEARRQRVQEMIGRRHYAAIESDVGWHLVGGDIQ